MVERILYPKSEKIQIIINNLKKVEKQASMPNALDMSETKVYSIFDEHKLGTTHCLSGWYAVACKDNEVIKKKIEKGFLLYDEGERLMVEHLGMGDRERLLRWVRKYPNIWGNSNGEYMFSSMDAYNYKDEGYKGILKHFKDFLERIKYIEKEMKK